MWARIMGNQLVEVLHIRQILQSLQLFQLMMKNLVEVTHLILLLMCLKLVTIMK